MTVDTTVFRGEFVAVRLVHQRNGGIAYVVFRPDAPSAVLDMFGTLEFANLVAQYVEQAGGSYEAQIRKAAKKYAREMISEGK